MQVSVEESGVIERKLTISVPSEKIDGEITDRLKGVAKKVRVPGFRPGKAPQSVIQKRYSPQVTNEVVSETINSSYMEALNQEKIFPAGLVSIEPTPYEAGKDLEFVATVELFPEIPVPTLDGITIEKPIVEVTEADIDYTLEDIRKRNCDYVEKKGKADKGDRLTIDFEGKIDGELFDGGKAEEFQFVLGEGQMLEEFDSGLMGSKGGETKTIAFAFPDDYGNEDVAGKDVAFTVDVKLVEKPELAELNDEFAASLGIAEGGIAKMREEIKSSLDRELETRMRSVLRDKIMDELYAANEIETPQALVKEEVERSVKAINEQLTAQGLPTDRIEPEHFEAEAKKRVALGLIAREVIETHEIRADEETVKARISEMASSYEDSEAYIKWHYSDPERLKNIEAVVLEELVVSRMLETATVKEQKVSFRTFMNPQAAD